MIVCSQVTDLLIGDRFTITNVSTTDDLHLVYSFLATGDVCEMMTQYDAAPSTPAPLPTFLTNGNKRLPW